MNFSPLQWGPPALREKGSGLGLSQPYQDASQLPKAGKFLGLSRVGNFGKRETKGNLAASFLGVLGNCYGCLNSVKLEVEQPRSRPSVPSFKW